MLFRIIGNIQQGGTDALKEAIILLLLSLPIMLLTLCVHEVAHGFVASKLGDPTAKSLGRLTLNPLKHLDPFGFLAMLLVGIGWAKPVPINTRYFKKPKRDMAICAAAGPVSNLLMAFGFMILLRLVSLLTELNPSLYFEYYTVFYATSLLLSTAAEINVVFAIFNLFPIPPLDGSKILYMFLPNSALYKILPYEQYISIGFIVYLMLERYLPIAIVSGIISVITSVVLWLFSLVLFF